MINQLVVASDLTPADFKKALESRKPIVVTFYMTGPSDDSQVHSSVLGLKNHYSNQVTFFDYLYTDAAKYGDLPFLLKVSTSPSVVVINGQSQVQIAWSGWVDAKSIEQGIVEAVNAGTQ